MAPSEDAPNSFCWGQPLRPGGSHMCRKVQAFRERLRGFGAAGWGLFAGCKNLASAWTRSIRGRRRRSCEEAQGTESKGCSFLYIRMERKYITVIINSGFYEQLGFHCLFEGFEKLTCCFGFSRFSFEASTKRNIQPRCVQQWPQQRLWFLPHSP